MTKAKQSDVEVVVLESSNHLRLYLRSSDGLTKSESYCVVSISSTIAVAQVFLESHGIVANVVPRSRIG